MKGVRFYLEYDSPAMKRKGVDTGNVFAAFVCNGVNPCSLGYDGIGSVLFDRNSPVASANASLNFLRKWCKRIPEKRAREIHPLLFERLDAESN